MFKKIGLTAAAALAALTAIPAAAEAQPYRAPGYYDSGAHSYAYRDGYRRYQRGDRYVRYNNRRYDNRRYDNRRYDRRYYGQRYCRDNGSAGTIIGAIAGGLLGHEVAGRGDRTVGTIIGGAAGAVAGRAIDRNC